MKNCIKTSEKQVLHEPHINYKLKKRNEKLKIPSSNISLFITNRKATKQA